MRLLRFKLLRDNSFWFTMYIFALGLVVTYMFYNPFFSKSHTLKSAVLGRSYPLPNPDILGNEGGTVRIEGVTAIVEAGTFPSAVYLRVDRTDRGNPIEVKGLWQITDIWETRFRFYSNDNDVKDIESKKQYILSFPYNESYLVTDQGVRFNETTLKLVRGETVTGPWTVLENGVVDVTNNTVSVLTNRGGFFMIAGGFYKPSVPEKLQNMGTSTEIEEDDISKKSEPKKIQDKQTVNPSKKDIKTAQKPRSIPEAVSNLSRAVKDFGSVLLQSFSRI